MPSVRVTGTFSRPADNTAYATGDIIANSGTAALVVPLTFYMPTNAGEITACSAVVTPASSNLVITALDFALLLFRPVTSIPFADAGYPADNTAMAITAAAFREHVVKFTFANGAWTNPAGALTAGATGYQTVMPNGSRPRVPYTTSSGNPESAQPNTLVGVVQCLGSWTPLGVVNRFDLSLDVTIS